MKVDDPLRVDDLKSLFQLLLPLVAAPNVFTIALPRQSNMLLRRQ